MMTLRQAFATWLFVLSLKVDEDYIVTIIGESLKEELKQLQP